MNQTFNWVIFELWNAMKMNDCSPRTRKWWAGEEFWLDTQWNAQFVAFDSTKLLDKVFQAPPPLPVNELEPISAVKWVFGLELEWCVQHCAFVLWIQVFWKQNIHVHSSFLGDVQRKTENLVHLDALIAT